MDKNIANTNGSYPLSKERLSEIFDDIWILSKTVGESVGRDCIVSGCEAAGDEGWVIMDGELIKVNGYNGSDNVEYIVHAPNSNVSTTNSEGNYVVIRENHRCEWVAQSATSPVDEAYHWRKIARLSLKTRLPDDDIPVAIATSAWTHVSGSAFSVQRTNGGVKFAAAATFTPYVLQSGSAVVLENPDITNLTVPPGSVVVGDTTSISDWTYANVTVNIPWSYRPKGDTVVPVWINGKLSVAAIKVDESTESAQLRFHDSLKLGDVININFWYEQ